MNGIKAVVENNKIDVKVTTDGTTSMALLLPIIESVASVVGLSAYDVLMVCLNILKARNQSKGDRE